MDPRENKKEIKLDWNVFKQERERLRPLILCHVLAGQTGLMGLVNLILAYIAVEPEMWDAQTHLSSNPVLMCWGFGRRSGKSMMLLRLAQEAIVSRQGIAFCFWEGDNLGDDLPLPFDEKTVRYDGDVEMLDLLKPETLIHVQSLQDDFLKNLFENGILPRMKTRPICLVLLGLCPAHHLLSSWVRMCTGVPILVEFAIDRPPHNPWPIGYGFDWMKHAQAIVWVRGCRILDQNMHVWERRAFFQTYSDWICQKEYLEDLVQTLDSRTSLVFWANNEKSASRLDWIDHVKQISYKWLL